MHSRTIPLTRFGPFAIVGRPRWKRRGEFHTTIDDEVRRTRPSTGAADSVGFEFEVFGRPPGYGCR